jgi:hypothetical protein
MTKDVMKILVVKYKVEHHVLYVVDLRLMREEEVWDVNNTNTCSMIVTASIKFI